MKKWVEPDSRPLAVKNPIGNPLTVSRTTSFSPSLAHFHLLIISPSQVLLSSLSLSLSLSQFIVSDYLGFFFFLKVKNNWFNRNGLTPLVR